MHKWQCPNLDVVQLWNCSQEVINFSHQIPSAQTQHILHSQKSNVWHKNDVTNLADYSQKFTTEEW